MLSDTKTRIGRSAVLGFHASPQTSLQKLCPDLRKRGKCARHNKEVALRREIAKAMEAKIRKKAVALYELQAELEETEAADEATTATASVSRKSKDVMVAHLMEELKREPEYKNWSLDAAVAEAMVEQGVRACRFAHHGAEVRKTLQQREKRFQRAEEQRQQQEEAGRGMGDGSSRKRPRGEGKAEADDMDEEGELCASSHASLSSDASFRSSADDGSQSVSSSEDFDPLRSQTEDEPNRESSAAQNLSGSSATHGITVSSAREAPGVGFLKEETKNPAASLFSLQQLEGRWQKLAATARRERSDWDRQRRRLYQQLSPLQKAMWCLLWQRRCVVPFKVVCENVREGLCREVEDALDAQLTAAATQQPKHSRVKERKASPKRVHKEEHGASERSTQQESLEAELDAILQSAAFEEEVDRAGERLVSHWMSQPQPLGHYDMSYFPQLLCHWSRCPKGYLSKCTQGYREGSKEGLVAMVLPITRYYFEGSPPQPKRSKGGSTSVEAKEMSRMVYPSLLGSKLTEKEVDLSTAANAEALLQVLELLLLSYEEEQRCQALEDAAQRVAGQIHAMTPSPKGEARKLTFGGVEPFPLGGDACMWRGVLLPSQRPSESTVETSELEEHRQDVFRALRLGETITETAFQIACREALPDRDGSHGIPLVNAMDEMKRSAALRRTDRFGLHAIALQHCQLTSADALLASLLKRPRLAGGLMSLDLQHNRLQSLRFLYQLRQHQIAQQTQKSVQSAQLTEILQKGHRALPSPVKTGPVTVPLVRLALAFNAITQKPDYQEQVRVCLPRLMALDGQRIRHPPLRLANPVATSYTQFALEQTPCPPRASQLSGLSVEEYRSVLDFIERFTYIWETHHIPLSAIEEADRQERLRESRKSSDKTATSSVWGGLELENEVQDSMMDVSDKKKRKRKKKAAPTEDELLALYNVEEEEQLSDENYPHRYHHPSSIFSFSMAPDVPFFDPQWMIQERQAEMEDMDVAEVWKRQHPGQAGEPFSPFSSLRLRLSAQDYREAQLFTVSLKNSSRNLLLGRRALEQIAKGSSNCYLAYLSTIYPDRMEVSHHLDGALFSITKMQLPSVAVPPPVTAPVKRRREEKRPSSTAVPLRTTTAYVVQLHGVMTWILPCMIQQLSGAAGGGRFFTAAYDRTLTLVPRTLPRQNRDWEKRKGHALVVLNDRLHLRRYNPEVVSSPGSGGTMSSFRSALLRTSAAAAPPLPVFLPHVSPARQMHAMLSWGLEGCWYQPPPPFTHLPREHHGVRLVAEVMQRARSDASFHAAMDVLVFELRHRSGPQTEESPGTTTTTTMEMQELELLSEPHQLRHDNEEEAVDATEAAVRREVKELLQKFYAAPSPKESPASTRGGEETRAGATLHISSSLTSPGAASGVRGVRSLESRLRPHPLWATDAVLERRAEAPGRLDGGLVNWHALAPSSATAASIWSQQKRQTSLPEETERNAGKANRVKEAALSGMVLLSGVSQVVATPLHRVPVALLAPLVDITNRYYTAVH